MYTILSLSLQYNQPSFIAVSKKLDDMSRVSFSKISKWNLLQNWFWFHISTQNTLIWNLLRTKLGPLVEPYTFFFVKINIVFSKKRKKLARQFVMEISKISKWTPYWLEYRRRTFCAQNDEKLPILYMVWRCLQSCVCF